MINSGMINSVLIANRAEIAGRIIRTAQRLGIKAIAVHSVADADLPFVAEADHAIELGPAPPGESYLDTARVLDAARAAGVDAIHPGYGFLSENAGFARAVIEAGLSWIGPTPDVIECMGDKINARNLMASAGVPVAPGTTEPVRDVDQAVAEAVRLGYPAMVKASAGGGGIGMAAVQDADELRSAFATARARAERFFGSPDILLERCVRPARHVEVQLLGLPDGRVIALGERDCSVQRRHQKVIEESPAPFVTSDLRKRMLAAAVRAGEAVGYRGAGTVEFLLDPTDAEFYFLEMNTRLQVEHPITELVTGIDLVEQQFRIAAGETGELSTEHLTSRGHAIELRVYAEDSVRFLPSPGTITEWREPSGGGIRIDAGCAEGTVVSPYYDPLLAKLCVWAPTREEAVRRARTALSEFVIEGPKTNLEFLAKLLSTSEFVEGRYDTEIVARLQAISTDRK